MHMWPVLKMSLFNLNTGGVYPKLGVQKCRTKFAPNAGTFSRNRTWSCPRFCPPVVSTFGPTLPYPQHEPPKNGIGINYVFFFHMDQHLLKLPWPNNMFISRCKVYDPHPRIVTLRRRGGRSRSRYNKFCVGARKRPLMSNTHVEQACCLSD